MLQCSPGPGLASRASLPQLHHDAGVADDDRTERHHKLQLSPAHEKYYQCGAAPASCL